MMRKRIFAVFVCLCMMVTLVPSMAYAGDIVSTGGLCEHHPQHDDACGYTEGTAEIPCSHVHNESCGGLTDPTACNHTHDEACGYVPATEGTPCTFVCEVCNAQDSGNPATPFDAQPEECTCETLCTEEKINADCPVCSAEGAELDKVCVGVAPMLPVTALAASAESLYVGNYQITSSDTTTYLKAGLTEGSLTEGSENDWTVKYDPSTATLTLSGATIMGSGDITSSSKGAGIYAQCNSDQSVSLTIELIGNNNTITGSYGIYVNAEMDTSIYGTDASLTITSEYNGSLEVSGSNHGIFVKSGTGKASLTINDASVVAKTTQTYSGYAGVYVQSSNEANSPQLSLTVNGGSLTASGGGNNDGIQFYVGAPKATNATTSLIVTDNAIVDAKNGGISAKQISNPINTDISATGSSGGIVFNGKNGTVYGDVTLQEDITIGEGESLTLDDGASLNAGNHNVIVDGGTLDENLASSLGDSVKYAPTITTHPQNVEVKEKETATFTVKATGTKPLSYQWQQNMNGSGWTDITGETNATYTTGKTTMDMNGTQYRCVVTGYGTAAESNAATLTVNAIPTYTITVQTDGHGTASATPTTAKKGEQITLTATPNSGYRFARWEVVSGNITITNNTFAMPAENVTIRAIFNRKSSGGSVFFWDLKFDTNGGSKIDTVTEWEYSTIDLDEYVPKKEGYKFVGWYADKDLTKKIDEVYLTEDTTVYAKWEKIEEEVPEEPEEVEETETISFKDVKESDWFYEAVSYAVENSLMSGMSEDIFAPNTPLTREMLAVVLYNVEGQPESAEANTFTDVKGGMWYTDAILWASKNGIVAGYDNGAYGVGDHITREQFAAILYLYAQFKGYDTTQGGMAVREYSDYEAISDYARPAVAWAVNAGIMGGMDNGTLNPQGKATRAEAAAMLMNFCENVVEK